MINYCAWMRQVPPRAGTLLYYSSQEAWVRLSRMWCSNDTDNNGRRGNTGKSNKIPTTDSKKMKQPDIVSKAKVKFGWKMVAGPVTKIRNSASVNNAQLNQKMLESPAESNHKDKGSMRSYGYNIFFAGLCGCVMWAIYEMGKPEQDYFGRSIEDELSSMSMPKQYIQRMWRSVHYYQKMLREPVPTRLLPNELQAPYLQPRYTLVLEMSDVLVHPDWTYQTGWRFKKRPGVDHFLRQCSKHFEIVVYTSEQGMTAFPILDALDPNGYIRYRLVRDATQFVDGKHVKNLNRLNRNLKRLIVVDWDRAAVPLHQDNLFSIIRWLGNDDDVQLFDLAAFLGLIAEHKVSWLRYRAILIP